MEKDVLGQVIEAEKEIQKCLESEKIKARQWLERVRRESEEAFLLEQKKIKEALEQSLAEAARQAELKAEEIVHQAAASAERLGQLSPETLRPIVERRLPGILPG